MISRKPDPPHPVHGHTPGAATVVALPQEDAGSSGRACGEGLWSRLRAGLITGAADDDPSGIATYSQAGAQFRFGLVWTLLITTPLMIAVQVLSARIGCVTGQGLASNMKKLCPAWVTHSLIALLLVANTINIAADISAMGESLALLVPAPHFVFVLSFGAACVAGQIWLSYESTVRGLKWLTLALFAYVAVVLMAHVPWREAAAESLQPWRHLAGSGTKAYAGMVVAMLGTTISPYLFFWQASQEAEDARRQGMSRFDAAASDIRPATGYLQRIKLDTRVGMLMSNSVAFCVVVATAATLHAHGATSIETAAQAAKALEPAAGRWAVGVFALGIIGTGLLAVPVLAGSAAYAVSEVFGWKKGLSRGFREARGFYTIIIVATGLGTAMSMLAVSPMKALVWSAVVNGVISVPIMVVMMLIGQNSRLMGRHTIGPRQRLFGWVATAVMGAAVLAMGAAAFF